MPLNYCIHIHDHIRSHLHFMSFTFAFEQCQKPCVILSKISWLWTGFPYLFDYHIPEPIINRSLIIHIPRIPMGSPYLFVEIYTTHGWLMVEPTPLKNIRQLGLFIPNILGNKLHVPVTTNQSWFSTSSIPAFRGPLPFFGPKDWRSASERWRRPEPSCGSAPPSPGNSPGHTIGCPAMELDWAIELEKWHRKIMYIYIYIIIYI